MRYAGGFVGPKSGLACFLLQDAQYGLYIYNVKHYHLQVLLGLLWLFPVQVMKAQEESFESFMQTKREEFVLTEDMKAAEKSYNEKILERMKIHLKNGFGIYQEDRVTLIAGKDRSVYIPLVKGQWYHFVYVGDPHAEKISVNLFLDGLGYVVNDRLKPQQTGEYWSEFSFICPQSGMYELMLFQRCGIIRPLSYLTVFQKSLQDETLN